MDAVLTKEVGSDLDEYYSSERSRILVVEDDQDTAFLLKQILRHAGFDVLSANNGKEALNFQITVSIAIAICIPLMFILIGIPLMFIVGIGALVLTIMAAVKVSNGNFDYRYPLTIRLLK